MLFEPKYQVLLTSCFGAASLYGQFRINEIDSDTPGTNDTAEYVEIFRPDGTGDSLAGHVLVFFDGDDSSDSVYQTIDLNFSNVDPTGYFVIGGQDLDFGQVDLFFGFGPGGASGNFIRNNTSAIALYSGTTGADYLDGSLTTPVANADLVDVIIHRVGTAEDATLAAVFGPDDQPDENENENSVSQSLQRNPDGGSAFRTGELTIKLTNTPLPRLTALPSPIQVDEDAGVGASVITVTREGDISQSLGLNISVSPFDETRLIVPNFVNFEANEATTSFSVDTVPNITLDGTAIFEITLSETLGPGSQPSLQNGIANLVIRDEESPTPTLVINELLRNGEGGSGPEFLEIHNDGLSSLDLTDYQIMFFSSDPDAEFGTVQRTITIRNGSIPSGGYFTIGNEQVGGVYPGASPDLTIFGLDLPNEDTTIILRDEVGSPVYSVLLQDGELDAVPNLEGVPLAADLIVGQDEGDQPSGYFLTEDAGEIAQVLESVEAGVQAEGATPGEANAISPTLFLTRNLEVIDEDDTDVVTFTVTRVPDLAGDLAVTIFSDDTTELTVPAAVTILDGESSATFSGMPVTDGFRDGNQLVNVTVSASDHDSGNSEVGVLDSNIPDLVTCDIAFVAAISVGVDDVFAFVALVDIFEGTRITFTDRGWRAVGGFLEAGEDSMDWLAVSDVPAGTVVTFTNNQPDIGTASSGGPDLSDSGDQIFAYQGSSSNPTLLAGIQMNGAWDADATDIHTSALPAVLASAGGVAIDPEQNNAVYTGITSGSPALLKTFLFSADNFTSGNDNSTAGPGLIPDSFVVGEPYSVTNTDIEVIGNSAVISFTASGLSDIYVTTDLLVWALANGGEDVESGQFIDSNRPAERAFYLVQEANAEAP